MFQIDPRHLPGQGSATEEGEGMNCRPGELAFVVGGNFHEHRGRVVSVVRPSPVWADSWVTNPVLRAPDGVPVDYLDSHLRPIRDNDGEDETLTWAGKPEAVPA